ncbi:MAG: caspase family protein [Saprospiraceae bacterium]|nr:caspase family protein [Saprospiraceae bacterium]
MRLTLILFLWPSMLAGAFAQCLEGDCRNGMGKYRYKSMAVYKGKFLDTRPHGTGSLYYSNGDVYTGQWLEGKRHGRGAMVFKVGDRYDGEFARGKFHGKGVYTFRNDVRFDGMWEEGKPNGYGTHYKPGKDPIAGHWKDGRLIEADTDRTEVATYEKLPNCNLEYCASGIGIFTYPDGSRYEGEFTDGRPAGQGVVDYTNGDRYIGYWQSDEPDGKGKMIYRSGDVLDGLWSQGKFINGDRSLAQTSGASTKIYALIVGVSRYDKFKTLKYTDDDAYRVYAFLKSPEGGAVHDDQIHILVDESATKSNIDNALDEILLRADENDAVFCFFSGHGLSGSFLPIDSDGYQNNLEYEEVKEKLARCKANNKLYVADACYSGSLLAARTGLTKSLELFYNKMNASSGGTAFLVSSKPEEYSLESQGLRQGVFSHYLIKGLKGAADHDLNQIVTVEELFAYVHQHVREYTKNVQTPVLAGQFDRNMPVSMIR